MVCQFHMLSSTAQLNSPSTTVFVFFPLPRSNATSLLFLPLKCGCESNRCLYLESCLHRDIHWNRYLIKFYHQSLRSGASCDPVVQSRNTVPPSQCLTRLGCFSAVPSAPYGITLLSCDGTSMTLAWKRPKYTGGSRITSYYVDKREADSVLWKEVSSRPAASRVYKVSSSYMDSQFQSWFLGI